MKFLQLHAMLYRRYYLFNNNNNKLKYVVVVNLFHSPLTFDLIHCVFELQIRMEELKIFVYVLLCAYVCMHLFNALTALNTR